MKNKINRISQWTKTKRHLIRMAVDLRIWRKSPMGFTKNGIVVFGRDIEANKYKYDELITVGSISEASIHDLLYGHVYQL